MLSKALLTATVIGAATAQNLPPIARREFLEDRQFDGVPATCESAISAIETIYSSAPTPPADLLSVTIPADPCVTPSFTGKLASEWSSYTDAALEWYYDHTSEINAVLTACSDIIEQATAGLNPADFPTCSTGFGGAAASTKTAADSTITATTTPAPSSSSTGGAASTGASTSSASATSTVNVPNAAARETGFAVVAAVAAAGFMGAVAVL